MKKEKGIMAKYKDVIVTAGSGGFGGPLHLHPNERQRCGSQAAHAKR